MSLCHLESVKHTTTLHQKIFYYYQNVNLIDIHTFYSMFPLPLYYITHHEPLTSGVIIAPILNYPNIEEPTLLELQESIQIRKISKTWNIRQICMSRIDNKEHCLEVSPW